MKKTTVPKIEFSIVEDEITESPTLGAVAVKQLVKQLNLEKIAAELKINKHHGVSIEDIILVLLLYSSYGVTSILALSQKAKKDPSLNSIINDVEKINNKIFHYFQKNISLLTYQQLLDRVLSSCLNNGRFKSTKQGILIVDDSPLIKTGKKMEKIEIIFDHVEKRYVLGYVLVATSYADTTKSYCVNFQIRLSTEQDKENAKKKKLKKTNKIDLRSKGSLLKWINIQRDSGHTVQFTDVSGINLNSETLKGLDEIGVNWIGLPNSKTPLFDQEMTRYNFENLCQTVGKINPIIFEIEGFQAHVKKIFLKDYGPIYICIIKGLQDIESGTFMLKNQATDKMISNVQEYFTRQQPADNNKLNIALDLFERAKDQDIKAETICADGWFFVAWFVNKALKLKGIMRFISRIKSNAEVEYKGKLIKIENLWELISLEPVLNRSMKACAVLVRIKGFDGYLKIVFIQELTKSGKLKARYVLVCTDVFCSKTKVIKLYKLRWSIECFFRTAKQRFGLDKFHVRKFNEIIGHITFVFISYLLLACLKIITPEFANYTFGQIIDMYLNRIVKLQYTAKGILVLLGKTFFEEFGEPMKLLELDFTQ